jgi:DNA-nicking Smr family endonuclease
VSLGRRKRRLTAEETRLWHGVARSVNRRRGQAAEGDPIAEDGADAGAPVAPAAPIPPAPAVAAPSPPTRPASPTRPAKPAPSAPSRAAVVDLAPDPIATLGGPQALERRRHARLVRGKLAPEARLDLHGMTREAAHAALIGFVQGAQARGLRIVLVITGKGRPDASDAVVPERTGILRHSLGHWLAAPPLTGRVVDVRPAHQRHGGAGAVYLVLRRRR